ncbi:3-oxoacyl-[acyl-carrier protein] reductase [Aestuariispira insulae]|uniref:3-oxoacyl-[acyl-carrier protein] reductase n=2 Tax=Aestuariispira insulae TaxID=1461337 RepID=A0A3D9H478_9PROT|nr:SDR family oxidoreductase [Aestuariispira insulae]RED44292.1 3-oxoacyl-[acyl-carrier protein] reductase [Aestuariispira insulae]
MIIDFSGKTALVTAGSKGIGFGIAQNLHRMGANVSICARNQDGLDEAIEKMSPHGADRLYAMVGDIGDPSFLKELTSSTASHFSDEISILVNNNGGPPSGDTLEMTEEQWDGAINRNMLSVIRLAKLVVPGMKKNNWGRIINLTSLTAKEPESGMVLSNVTRAGVVALSKTLSRDLGPFGITVNTILTGGVLTERAFSFIREEIETTGETLEEACVRIGKTLPIQHIASPEEFSQMILFMASEAAGYLTGTAIPLDGGASHGGF